MATEAQMIMTLSMKKIVESRSRRGGASLHRNLLVAGVLFKARDVLLTGYVVAAADDSSDGPPSPDADTEADRKSCDEDEEMECERTGGCDVRSASDCKENVPPSSPTPDHPRCDDVQPVKTRGGKRLSRDAADDEVTPCKTTRSDADDVDRGPTEPAMDVVDDDDDDDDAVFSTVSDAACRQTCAPSSCPAVASSSVAWWSSTVNRLPCLDSRLTQNIGADPPLVRPLLVVQVV